MIRIFLSALFSLLLYVPVASLSASQSTELFTPVQVVAAFQKLPDYEMLCQDETLADWEPAKVGAKFETYLSKELYKLFMWSQCRNSDTPPYYGDLHNFITWDIRYGNGRGYDPATNIRIRLVKSQGADRTIVKLLFDYGRLKKLVTTYTLIREDGHWKIDDIAPKGDFKPDDEDYDTLLEHSDSIKTDMQNNYRAAEARYQQEQAKKSAPKK